MRRGRERVYISGRFSQQEQFREIRRRILNMGHSVVSTWLDQEAAEPKTRAGRQEIAVRDLVDVKNSTLAMLDFSLPPRGGRECEFGAFLAEGTECWVIANANEGNVFTALPDLTFPDWDRALIELWKQTYEA